MINLTYLSKIYSKLLDAFFYLSLQKCNKLLKNGYLF